MEKDYEQRIINLLKKADSVAGTPEEDVFRAKAMELIAKYNFDAAKLRDKSQGRAEIICKTWQPVGHHIKSQISLYNVLCLNHSCQAIQLSGRGVKPYLKVYGTEESVQQVDWLYGILWPNALSQTLAQKPDWPGYTKGDVTVYRRSFLYGFIGTIKKRLEEANATAKNDDAGTGLILMDDFRRAQAKLKEEHPDARAASSQRQVNGEAMGRGKIAGARSDIGQTRVQNTRRAIGA